MADHDSERSHPGPAQYVEIALVLAGLTAVEVLLYVFGDDLGRNITKPVLLVLTVAKFSLVGLWFMHLRFDHRLLRRVFTAGIALAIAVFAVVLANFYIGGPGF